MGNYGFADGHGNQITRGLQCTEDQARERAQQWANERGDTVEYWVEGSPDESVAVTPEAG